MATCSVQGCGREVETHRYIRAEPLAVEERNGRELLTPAARGASIFCCLSHPLGEIEATIERLTPPSAEIPVRVLWSPAPGVKLSRKGVGVVERRSNDGHHGVRTALVRDGGALHTVLPELLPEGTNWYIPHAGAATPQEAADVLTRLFGDDDETSAAIRAKLARLGKD